MNKIMKKHIVAMLLLLAWSTLSLADDWTQSFRDIYYEKSIDEAVVHALSEGIAPDQIIKAALPLKELKQEELVKALYCALVPPAYILDAAIANGITEQIVQQGYELALAQCAEEMEEKENAAPAFIPGNAANPAGNTSTASPWTFEK